MIVQIQTFRKPQRKYWKKRSSPKPIPSASSHPQDGLLSIFPTVLQGRVFVLKNAGWNQIPLSAAPVSHK